MILSIPAIITTTLVWSISLIAWIAYYYNNDKLYDPTRYIVYYMYLYYQLMVFQENFIIDYVVE